MTSNADYGVGEVTCADCHRTYECTPLDDHYEPAWGGPRVCYQCLLVQSVARNALPPIDGSGA
jgi:hypothetical protein